MIVLYAIGLAFSIWGVVTDDPDSFWFAWCLAFAIANGALLLREASK